MGKEEGDVWPVRSDSFILAASGVKERIASSISSFKAVH